MNTELEFKILKALGERYKQGQERKIRPYSKDILSRSRNSTVAGGDPLNSSMNSELNHTRYSSQLNNSYDPKIRIRTKTRNRIESLDTSSMSLIDSFSTRPNTSNFKTKVTFMDSAKHANTESH